MSKRVVELRVGDHLKDQDKRDRTIAALDAHGLIPDRNPDLLYELGSKIGSMTAPDEFELPPRGDPKSRAPLPQFKK